ncbi:MAG: hypothetical protein V4481_01640 [Patescibacteria group bacterium]
MSNNSSLLVIDLGSEHMLNILSITDGLNIMAVRALPPRAESILSTVNPIGIILAGGNANASSVPHGSLDMVLKSGLPLFAIGSAMLWLAQQGRATVSGHANAQFGSQSIHLDSSDPLFAGLEDVQTVWVNHHDIVTSLPPSLRSIGCHPSLRHLAAFSDRQNRWWGTHFHPEHEETVCGRQMFANFVERICKQIHKEEVASLN